MSQESTPGVVIGVMQEGSVSYILQAAGREERVFLTCQESGGALRWRQSLPTPDLVVDVGKLRIEEGHVVATIFGEHCKGGTSYQWTFHLTLEGTVVKRKDGR